MASGQPRDALCHGARAASKTRVGGPAPPKQEEPPKAWAAPKQAALKAWAAPKREREQFSSYSTLPLLVRRLLAVRIHKGSAGYAGRVWHRRQWRQWGSRRLQQLPLASLCTVLVGLASNAVPPLRQLVLVLKTRMRRENLVSRIAGKYLALEVSLAVPSCLNPSSEALVNSAPNLSSPIRPPLVAAREWRSELECLGATCCTTH